MPNISNYKISIVFLIQLICSLMFNNLFGSINLEHTQQKFVLNTKRIVIEEYPDAFNPSIVNWRGATLMSFRVIPTHYSLFPINSSIGLIWLNDDLNPDGPAQILDLNPERNYFPPIARTDDARLIVIDEHLYIVYSDNTDPFVTEGGFRVYVAELDYDGKEFTVLSNERITDFEGQDVNRREKNWSPFEYNGELLLAYSIAPHKILKPLLGTGNCDTAGFSWSSLKWNWGELRGGTPCLKMNNQYLGFFHSVMDLTTIHSDGEHILHYFIGAYTFGLNPPFQITQISPEPIIAKGFYSGTMYRPYWKPVRVVFPCGYIFDEDYIWLSYGRQDHEIWIVKLDKKGLLDSLISTSSEN